MLFSTIQPDDNAFTDFDRLVLMPELHSTLEIIEIGRYRSLDLRPKRLPT